MKKILISAVVVLFFIVVPVVHAQEEILPPMDATVSAATPTPVKQTDYQLPYPGLLPDSPLYQLKTLRDRLISFLVSDPLKQAEFNLLQADKRLAAGWYLVDKNRSKALLAESTIQKGENYFEDAIAKVKEAKKMGVDTSLMVNNLQRSAQRHKKVIQNLKNKAPSNVKKNFAHLEQRIIKIEKKANQLSKN